MIRVTDDSNSAIEAAGTLTEERLHAHAMQMKANADVCEEMLGSGFSSPVLAKHVKDNYTPEEMAEVERLYIRHGMRIACQKQIVGGHAASHRQSKSHLERVQEAILMTRVLGPANSARRFETTRHASPTVSDMRNYWGKNVERLPQVLQGKFDDGLCIRFKYGRRGSRAYTIDKHAGATLHFAAIRYDPCSGNCRNKVYQADGLYFWHELGPLSGNDRSAQQDRLENNIALWQPCSQQLPIQKSRSPCSPCGFMKATCKFVHILYILNFSGVLGVYRPQLYWE